MAIWHNLKNGPEVCSRPLTCVYEIQNHYSTKAIAQSAYDTSEINYQRSVPKTNSRVSGTGDLDPNILTESEIQIFSLMKRRHPKASCKGTTCILHNPIDHHMRYWPPIWHPGNPAVMRVCPHGLEHPDPSVLPYLNSTVFLSKFKDHKCDGCCE